MIGRVLWRFAEVDSTQNIAFRLAELGAEHGTVVRADYQSAGRGRQGKTWESAAGSALMFSILLRPTGPLHELGSLSILTAETLADVLGAYVSARVQIKWPNDVLIGGQKVSGILLQTRSGQNPVAALGIGINIDSPVGTVPEGATSLNEHAPDSVSRETLLEDLLHRINSMWQTHKPELSNEQVVRLEARLWQKGEMVSVIDADREVQGRIEGLAKNGELRLSVEGSERVVVAGEIARGPRPISGSNGN